MRVLLRTVGLAPALESPGEADGGASMFRDGGAGRGHGDQTIDTCEGRVGEATNKGTVGVVVSLLYATRLFPR